MENTLVYKNARVLRWNSRRRQNKPVPGESRLLPGEPWEQTESWGKRAERVQTGGIGLDRSSGSSWVAMGHVLQDEFVLYPTAAES